MLTSLETPYHEETESLERRPIHGAALACSLRVGVEPVLREVKDDLLDLEQSTPALVGNTRDRIVCRLGCPSSRPASTAEGTGVAFASLAAARAAGYRPCPLCRPD